MENVFFQQRLRELESRIRKWRFLKLGIMEVRLRPRDRRSTSADQRHKECASISSSPHHQRPNNIGYLTSPMERKFTPLSMKPSPSRRDTEKDALEDQYVESFKKSGILDLYGIPQLVDHNEITILELLGSGSCGVVESAMVRNKLIAVKTMYKNNNKDNLKRILRDVRIMSACRCPFIVSSYGYFMFDSSVKICMQKMDTCCEKLLRRLYHSQLDFFPETVAGRISYSSIRALRYLEQQHSIIHRDIKPSNILFDENGNVKICDFGISGFLINAMAHSNNAGCPPYMAPERLTIETNCTYDVRSDVWSLGVTLYQLVTGRYPFPLHDLEFTTLTIIADLSINSPSLSDDPKYKFSESFIDFLDLCLMKNVKDRPNYVQLMEHKFYSTHRLDVIEKMNQQKDEVAEWYNEVIRKTKRSDEIIPIPNTPCVN